MGCSAKLNECIVFRGAGQRWFGDLGRSGRVGSWVRALNVANLRLWRGGQLKVTTKTEADPLRG
jgi:hypothetical protein